MRPRHTILATLAILVAGDVTLLLSGRRVLIEESYVPASAAVISASFYEPETVPTYSCTYFTGRSRTYESLPAAISDECPFIWSAG